MRSLHFETDAYCCGNRRRRLDDKKLATVTCHKPKTDTIPTELLWSTFARSRKTPTVCKLLPPRKRRKFDFRPSGSSEAAVKIVDEACCEETQIDDDSTHQHCACVIILNAEKEVLKT